MDVQNLVEALGLAYVELGLHRVEEEAHDHLRWACSEKVPRTMCHRTSSNKPRPFEHPCSNRRREVPGEQTASHRFPRLLNHSCKNLHPEHSGSSATRETSSIVSSTISTMLAIGPCNMEAPWLAARISCPCALAISVMDRS